MNSTTIENTSAALQYVLRPRPPLVSGISDHNLSLVVPVVAHWLTAAVYELFHFFNIFQQYKIHTSEEELAKNTVSRLECLRGVLLVQVCFGLLSLPVAGLIFKHQVLQTGLGIVLGVFSEVEMIGNEDLDTVIWARRVHVFCQTILTLLSSSGLNVKALFATLSRPFFTSISFAPQRAEHELEFMAAKLICYGLIPTLRLYVALWLADTWVFFIHRAEHSNKWIYSKWALAYSDC